MKVKNKDLASNIQSLTSLKSIVMDGDITLSAIKRRKELFGLYENYDEAKTKILESKSKKDEKGNPVKIYEDIPGGGQNIGYSFDTPEISAETLKLCNELDNIENDLADGHIDSSRVLSFRTTPEQLEGLLLITKPE